MALVDDQHDFYKKAGKRFSTAFTSFNELTVASPRSLFDLKSTYGISTLRDKIEVTGTGDVTNSEGLYTITTGATGGSTASLSSVDRGRYIAGFDATPGIAVAVPVLPTGSQVARWGYFDDNNGFGTGVDADGFFTFIRVGGVERTHRREDWKRSLTSSFQENRLNIYRYPFRWYGGGPVVFQVSDDEFDMYPAMTRYDTFEVEGSESITEQANLKIRAEVEGGGDFSIKVGGRQFLINGDYNPLPRLSSERRLAQSVGTTFVPLISCKQVAGTLNSVACKLASIPMLVASADIVVQIRIGSTVTEPVSEPSDIPSGESAMLYDNTATTVSGGHKIYETVIAAGQGNAANDINNALPELALPDDQIITLCARSVSGTATVTSVLTIKEEW